MTWTYSADPSSSKKDAVRFLIGDVVESAPMVQDEEIYFNLNEVGGEIYRAASNSWYNLAAQFTGEAQSTSKSVGGLTLSKTYGDKALRYERLAKDLLARSRRLNPPIPNADPAALGAELTVGKFDRYWASKSGEWPSNSVLGVTSTYGVDQNPDEDD